MPGRLEGSHNCPLPGMVALPSTFFVNSCLCQTPPSLDCERSCYLVEKLQTKKRNVKDLEKLGSPILFLEVCEDVEGPSEKADTGENVSWEAEAATPHF